MAKRWPKPGWSAIAYVRVKLLVKGDLTKKVPSNCQAASDSAVEAVQKAGGSFEKTARLARPRTCQPKQTEA